MLVGEFEMNDVLTREATEANLPAIGRLLEDLTNAMDDTEGMDIGIAVRNCRNLPDDAGSHFLVAEKRALRSDSSTSLSDIPFCTGVHVG